MIYSDKDMHKIKLDDLYKNLTHITTKNPSPLLLDDPIVVHNHTNNMVYIMAHKSDGMVIRDYMSAEIIAHEYSVTGGCRKLLDLIKDKQVTLFYNENISLESKLKIANDNGLYTEAELIKTVLNK